MKKLTTLLMALMLMSTALWADETVTVSAKSTDISEGLDLKVVAKLFAEAKNLEEFETMLNNPDSAFCNLDLNGDGQVDYLRVVETGEGNKRLVVLQAILAKDIFQDVASIYVEKDAKEEVKVQIVGDEYVYGTNYVIEPVYVYRPVIYDWFWCDSWYAWNSPWYWGYYPGWWYSHACWSYDWYWRHCYAFHRYHCCCTFHHAYVVSTGYYDLHRGVSRREYAVANPDRSFARRNAGMTNAREIRGTSTVSSRSMAGTERRAASGLDQRTGTSQRGAMASARNTFGSTTRSSAGTSSRTTSTASSNRSTGSTATASRSTAGTTASSRSTGSVATSSRSTGTTTTASRSTGTTTTASRSTGAATRSTGTATRSTSAVGSSTRSTATRSSAGSTRTSSGSTSGYSGSRSSGSTRSGGTYSGGSYGGSSRSGGGGYSGGGSRGGGGGGGSRRR